jgi:hypothetical protein
VGRRHRDGSTVSAHGRLAPPCRSIDRNRRANLSRLRRRPFARRLAELPGCGAAPRALPRYRAPRCAAHRAFPRPPARRHQASRDRRARDARRRHSRPAQHLAYARGSPGAFPHEKAIQELCERSAGRLRAARAGRGWPRPAQAEDRPADRIRDLPHHPARHDAPPAEAARAGGVRRRRRLRCRAAHPARGHAAEIHVPQGAGRPPFPFEHPREAARSIARALADFEAAPQAA